MHKVSQVLCTAVHFIFTSPQMLSVIGASQTVLSSRGWFPYQAFFLTIFHPPPQMYHPPAIIMLSVGLFHTYCSFPSLDGKFAESCSVISPALRMVLGKWLMLGKYLLNK